MRRILNWRVAALLVFAALVAMVLFFLPELLEWLQDLTVWCHDHQLLGMVIFATLYVPAAVLFFPGSVMTLAAGYALGPVAGTIAVSIGATLGACVAFWMGRTFARGWVEKKLAGSARFRALDEGVAGAGFKIVLLTRLSPVFPFTLLNYAFGLTRVRFRDYALASWLGMLPGGIMYVYLGTAVRNFADIMAGRLQPTLVQQVLFVAGLVATVVVTILITRIARAALKTTSPQLGADSAVPSHEPTVSNPPSGQS